MRINVTRPGGFKYAFHGINVVEYAEGLRDVPQEVAELALQEGWCVAAGAAPAAAAVRTPAVPAAAESPATVAAPAPAPAVAPETKKTSKGKARGAARRNAPAAE